MQDEEPRNRTKPGCPVAVPLSACLAQIVEAIPMTGPAAREGGNRDKSESFTLIGQADKNGQCPDLSGDTRPDGHGHTPIGGVRLSGVWTDPREARP